MRRARTWLWTRMLPIAHRKEGRAYSLPPGPRRIASRICPDLISDRHSQFPDGAGAECTGEQLAVVLQGAPGTATTNTAVIPRRSRPRAAGFARLRGCSA